MTRLKQVYHIDFKDFLGLRDAWENTPPEDLAGWEAIAQSLAVSTYAMVWSYWQVWVKQFNDPNRINPLYLEWQFRNTKLPWPFGTLNIPTAELGKSKCGKSALAMTEKNAII